MTEISVFEGPLDDALLKEVGNLYGQVDAKYRRPTYLRHLFVENTYGWALHAFAYHGDKAVGHCSVIPVAARVRGQLATSGKVEAFFVDEAHRKRPSSPGERSLGLQLLSAVGEAAAAKGIDPLHAYINPRVGAIFERDGYAAEVAGLPAFAQISTPSGRGLHHALTMVVATGQRAAAYVGDAVTRMNEPDRLLVEQPRQTDRSLVDIPQAQGEVWTVAGIDAWDWFTSSDSICALELPGRWGGRALVFHEGAGEPLHLLGWKPRAAGLRSALRLLSALARFGRDSSASTLRVQLGGSLGSHDSLVAGCRLMGWLPRDPFSIYTRWRGTPARVEPSPFFYITF